MMGQWAENLHQILQLRLTFLVLTQGSLVLQMRVSWLLMLWHQSLWLQGIGQLFLNLPQGWQVLLTLLRMTQGSLLLQIKVHWFQTVEN